MAIGPFREWMREQELNEAKIAKVELKDWERVIQLISTDKSPDSQAKSIKDKNKAMQRYVAFLKVKETTPKYTSYGSVSGEGHEFGDRALELGASKEEIQDLFDNTELNHFHIF